LELVEHAVAAVAQRHGESPQTLLVHLGGHVDADQIIDRAVAPTVAGIDEHGGIAGMNLCDEIRHLVEHVVRREVVALLNREPLLAQNRRIRLRVGHGLFKLADVLIVVVADDEGESVLRQRRRR
jgi:hypothetical protein